MSFLALRKSYPKNITGWVITCNSIYSKRSHTFWNVFFFFFNRDHNFKLHLELHQRNSGVLNLFFGKTSFNPIKGAVPLTTKANNSFKSCKAVHHHHIIRMDPFLGLFQREERPPRHGVPDPSAPSVLHPQHWQRLLWPVRLLRSGHKCSRFV